MADRAQGSPDSWRRRMAVRWRNAQVRGGLLEERMDAADASSPMRAQAQLSRVRHGLFPPGGYGT